MAGVIHPITPTMFKNMNFPDYMFGVAFSAMAIGMFLSSPFWGKTGDRIGHANVMAITMPGYAAGQYLFGLAQTPFLSTMARLMSGVFCGGMIVASMAYAVNATDDRNRARIMSYYAAFNSLSTAIGYFAGGVIGNISLDYVFIMQSVILICTSAAIWLFVAEPHNKVEKYGYATSLNPFSAMLEMKRLVSDTIATFLTAVFLTSFATTAFDNAFNFFIKAEFGFPASYNGIIKAAIGLIGLVANFTINIYLTNKTNVRRSIVAVLTLCGISAFAVFFISNVTFFIIASLAFFTFNSIYLPIQQVLVTKESDVKSSGVISGIFNSVRSMGMIFGSLFAGFIYSMGSTLPFICSAIAFCLGAFISYINYLQYNKTRKV